MSDAPQSQPPRRIWTIGHSTRSLEAFIDLLRAHGVRMLVDVRQYPSSRRYPHFNGEALAAALAQHAIGYRHLVSLGGRRRPAPDSINRGWRHESFRGYADYMRTPAFVEALHELEAIALASPAAIMCAEAVPWRCHRRLIADSLTARCWEVLDILDATPARPHEMTSFAIVRGESVTYPPPEDTDETTLFDP